MVIIVLHVIFMQSEPNLRNSYVYVDSLPVLKVINTEVGKLFVVSFYMHGKPHNGHCAMSVLFSFVRRKVDIYPTSIYITQLWGAMCENII